MGWCLEPFLVQLYGDAQAVGSICLFYGLVMVVLRGVICVYFGPRICHTIFSFCINSEVLIIFLKPQPNYFTEYNGRVSLISLSLNKSVNKCSLSDVSMVRSNLDLLKCLRSFKDVRFQNWEWVMGTREKTGLSEYLDSGCFCRMERVIVIYVPPTW